MKKRKPPEQGRPEFNNNPFTSLKKLKPATTSPQPAKTPARKIEHEDEAELFQQAMSGARRLDKEAEETPAASNSRNSVEKQAAGGDQEQQLFLQAICKMGSTLRLPSAETEPDEQPHQSSSNRKKQLRRGAIRISAELDLHGCLREEALAKLGQFLATAHSRGQKAVLVITGKGVNSPDGPVLQGAVADWLRDKGRGVVAEFGPAPRDRGGSGAFVVFLKTNRELLDTD